MREPTQEELLKIVEYRDGKLFWRDGRKGRGLYRLGRAGSTKPNSAGTLRINITINGVARSYLQHRIIYIYHYGKCPQYLDHINRDRLDNRIENLRPATRSQNNYNAGLRRDNTSGIKGICWHSRSRKWYASVMVAGKSVCLGCFSILEEAAAAVVAARAELHGEYACHG